MKQGYIAGLVSIVTPAYNARKFIDDTVESVLSQSYKNWELLIVDDRSTDGTYEYLLDKYASIDNVHVHQMEQNGGPAKARQHAVEKSNGQYVAFLDSDDVWLPEKLEKQVNHLMHSTAALSFTQFRRMDENGESVGRLIGVPLQMDYKSFLSNTAITTSTVLIDRFRVGEIAVKKTLCDDIVLWASILKKGFIAEGLQEDLLRYRVVSKSWSRNKVRNAWWMWQTYRHDEGLSRLRSFRYFAGYASRGVLKYLRF